MSQLKIKNGNNWESIPAGGIGVPSGGTTGQVLQKSSGTDYATGWADLPLAPKSISYPLSADQKSPWTFTAPSIGMLNLMLRSNSRTYIAVYWNGNNIIGFALSGTQENVTQQVMCNKGDVVEVANLSTNTYLLTGTSFISFE